MIRIIDYGVGNIEAFLNAFKSLNIAACRARVPQDLVDASHLILPGVGHFDHAMKKLIDSGMRDFLDDLVLNKGIPILGVCVGMQMLATVSEEGKMSGLNWIPGKVNAFRKIKKVEKLRLPHMGWNNISPKFGSSLLYDVHDTNPQFYFLHSYFFSAKDKAVVAATANYGIDFEAAVSYQNIHGVQFHPEKSHQWGEKLLKSFVEIC